MTIVAVLVLVVGGIVAIRSDDDGDESATDTVEAPLDTTPTTDALVPPPPTDLPTTTDMPSTETSAPPDAAESLAVVWQSEVDPGRVNATENRPTLEDGPLNAHVDVIAVTPGPDSSNLCNQNVDDSFESPAVVDSCLFIQWRLAVSDQATDTTQMYGIEAVTADGRQYEPLYTDFIEARPGTVDNLARAAYPNLGVGSRIFLSYSVEVNTEFIFGDWEIVVPDALQPVDWVEE